jgi:N6-L-threonylcarbamoyladenine synthase
MLGRDNCHFSFSGLKTAVGHAVDALGPEPAEADVADMAASFQAAVIDCLADRTARACALFRELHPESDRLVVAGGVAANGPLRVALADCAEAAGFRLSAPPIRLCTDNAAMIAWAGIERLTAGWSDPLDCLARARWPLDPDAAPAPGAGVKA